MDYRYIEQLLERYWNCATTPEEEEILRTFFRQSDVPANLRRYKALFNYEDQAAREPSLGDDFDRRVLAKVEAEKPVRARRVPMRVRLRPLWRAAASVAVVVLLGNAVQHSFAPDPQPAWDYSPDSYTDTYSDPQVAYDQSLDALRRLSDGFRAAGDTAVAAIDTLSPRLK